jgi:mannose-6-phosphate isomerase-like protein (cupin superfamily)
MMKVDDDIFTVNEGDVILIEDGKFHQVINDSNSNLYFVCVFDGNRNH